MRPTSGVCLWTFICIRVDEGQLQNCCWYAEGTLLKEACYDWCPLCQYDESASSNLQVYVFEIIYALTFTWRRWKSNADPAYVKTQTTKEYVTWAGEHEDWKWRVECKNFQRTPEKTH